jgi:GR25 family glycosyltransferase involved in LPS biosynthesis
MSDKEIKVVYIGRSKREDLWEYDFIMNDILPDKLDKKSYFMFLDDIRNTEETFDVLVYSARDPNNYPWGWMPTYEEILECVLKVNPKIIIQLSDEFQHEDLQVHNQLGNYCELFLRQHHHKNYTYTQNTFHIPLAYLNDFDIKHKNVLKIEDRKINWSLVGVTKSDRIECVKNFIKIEDFFINLTNENGYFTSREEIVDIYTQTIFCPSTRGWTTIYNHRSFESSICGAIPVIVATKDEIEYVFKYEENPPWLFFESWQEASIECLKLLENKEKLQYIQDEILLWWKNRVDKLKEYVRDIFIKDKLTNFPPVNFISIVESQDRRDLLYKTFKKYGISDITPHIYEKYDDGQHKIVGKDVDNIIPKHHRGPVTSHLKAIKEWYETTNEDYAFFCEDDLSFESVQYWNFTWEEFFNKLPENWECVQLCFISTADWYTDSRLYDENHVFRYRDWCDWSCCAYLIKRSHAKNIVQNYFNGDEIILEYKGIDYEGRERSDHRWLIPTPESMVYSYFKENSIYFIPLFLESLNFKSTWVTDESQNSFHTYSNISVLNWWKTIGKNLSLDAIIP